MPRPGPRPYECVRRAWHSERHQPIRGSLIQEIFRVANEIHSPTTKKNKEWQEKLPIVVLKAEEIMYSKANSEAEYMDLKTLWERANDAINTIIRRDEGSEETGEFLQPCIEAALHLGCIPRRVSRSQRNHHPRGYLTENMDLACATEGNPKTTSPLSPHYPNLLGKETRNFIAPTNSCITSEMPFLSRQICLPINGSFPSKPYPVYPLYYGVYSNPTELPTSKPISKDFPEMGIPQELPPCNEESCKVDLSLRLGFATVQEDVDKKSKVVGSRHESKGRLSLYCENNAGSGSEILMTRKRKAGEEVTNQRQSWHPKLMMSAYFDGGSRTAGL